MFDHIHHVAIIASDYARSKAFYTGVLGLPVIAEAYRAERDSWKLDLRLGDAQVELFSFPNPPARVSRPEACGLRHLALSVADLDAAVAGAMQAKLRNTGEACTAANRFHVQREIADEFAARLVDAMSGLKVGRGTEDGVNVGPLVEKAAVSKVSGLVEDATAAGAAVRLGGSALDGPGYFFAPTVLTGVPEAARVRREEIFGPVAPISVFDTEDEAVAVANDTEFGLVSYVFTSDLSRALRVSERLETGMVGLNQGVVSNPAAPFGGVKQSGIGREGGRVGIDEYLETKYVAIATP